MGGCREELLAAARPRAATAGAYASIASLDRHAWRFPSTAAHHDPACPLTPDSRASSSSRSPPRVGFPGDWYDLNSADHFWFQWRIEAALRQFRDRGLATTAPLRVLDVGGGRGVLRDQIEARTSWIVDLVELNQAALASAAPGRGRHLYYDVRDVRPDLLGSYDAAILYDVIEHVEQPRALLDAVARHLKPGGLLLLNVPALQSLFSAFDVAAGHYRRYDRRTLTAELAGWEILDLRYWGLRARSAPLGPEAPAARADRRDHPPRLRSARRVDALLPASARRRRDGAPAEGAGGHVAARDRPRAEHGLREAAGGPGPLVACLLHLALTAVLFGDVVFAGRVPYFRDVGTYYYPDYVFAADALRHGVWPLWNPTADAGAPYLKAYPVELLLLLLTGARGTLTVGPLLHVFAAMCGATWLARTLGVGRAGAWLAGAVFGLSGFLQSTLNLVPLSQGAALAPFVVAAYVRCVRRPMRAARACSRCSARCRSAPSRPTSSSRPR
jgi:SAM-dependent methyltransferase